MDNQLCGLWDNVVRYRLTRIVTETVSDEQYHTELKTIRGLLSAKSREAESKHNALLGLRSKIEESDIYKSVRKALQKVTELKSTDERVMFIVECSEGLVGELEELNQEFLQYLNETHRMFTLYFKRIRETFQAQHASTTEIFRDIKTQFETSQRALQQWKSNQLSSALVEERKLKGDLRDWATSFLTYMGHVLTIIQFFLDEDYRTDIRFDYDRSRKPHGNKYDCKVPTHLKQKLEGKDVYPKTLKSKELHNALCGHHKTLKAMMATLEKPQANIDEFVRVVVSVMMLIQDQASSRILKPTRMFVLGNEQRVAKELAAVQQNITRQKLERDQLQELEQEQLRRMGPTISDKEMESHRLLQDDITAALNKLNDLLAQQHAYQRLQSEMQSTIQAVTFFCPEVSKFETILKDLAEISKYQEQIQHRFAEKNEEVVKDYQRQCHTLMSNSLSKLADTTKRLHEGRRSLEQELWNDYYTQWLEAQDRLSMKEKHLVQRRNVDFKGNIDQLLLELDGIVEFTRQFQDQQRSESHSREMSRLMSLVHKTITA